MASHVPAIHERDTPMCLRMGRRDEARR